MAYVQYIKVLFKALAKVVMILVLVAGHLVSLWFVFCRFVFLSFAVVA